MKNCLEYLKKLTRHMHCWCKKTNTPPNIQGLVLPSFSILKQLEWHGFSEKEIRNFLEVNKITDELSTIVFNPQYSTVLLLHKAKSENYATDIELVVNYVKLFLLLFHNVLKSMKLIPFIVINGNFNPDDVNCHLCVNHMLLEEKLSDFSSWPETEEKENYFLTGSREKLKEDVSKRFLAKVLGVLAAASIHPSHIPTFINDQNSKKKMEHMKVLLTPEQMNIYYSQEKHMIIKGGFGCGKSIIAATMLEKIAQSLKNDEKLFHICYDARSELLNTQENDKVSTIHNKSRLMLSAIINNQITKLDRSEKLNFVIDEYDGEDLDNLEADELIKIFNKSLKESYVVLITQSIKKKRIIKTSERVLNTTQEKNRFDILEEKMKLYYLTSNMRNSKQIHKLIETTKEVLKEKQTVFIHPKDSKIGDENEERKEYKRYNKRKKTKENHGNTKKHLDEAESIKGSPMVNRTNNKDGSINEDQDRQENEFDAEHESKIQSGKGYNDSIIGLDEAQSIIGSPIENDTSANRLVSNFTHAEVNSIGHNIETNIPLLYELGDKEELDKSLSLVAIFRELLITSNKHVVLHFDTATNAIPSALRFAFDHLFINVNITTNYKDFHLSNDKSILVCSYPVFRGLEYSKVTVLIDRDIYFEQHYLVEALSRCTSELSIVVLQNSSAMDNVIKQWKTKELVNHRKIEITLHDNQSDDYTFRDIDKQTINGLFRPKYYEHLKEELDLSSIKSEITLNDIKQAAWNTIYKKR